MREIVIKCKQENPDWGYGKIAKQVGVSKDTVCYYLSTTRKANIRLKTKQRRLHIPLERKVDTFKGKVLRSLRHRSDDFQRRVRGRIGSRSSVFTYKDVLNKVGAHPVCYLTGKILDLSSPKSYALDHIVPAAHGGLNSLENLAIVDANVNKMKADLSVTDFIEVCRQVLVHAGYTVKAP